MGSSPNIQKAQSIIEGVKGKKLSVEERTKSAIELAGFMLKEGQRIQTRTEQEMQSQLARMMSDPTGKVFATSMTDQCFRTENVQRVADQFVYLLKKYGIPHFLSVDKRFGLKLFKVFGKVFPQLCVPLAKEMLRRQTLRVIMPGEEKKLSKHMRKRENEGVRINLNHLGEAILGEGEAEKRLKLYIQDLKKPEVEYISVKISTIGSQLNLLSWEDTLKVVAERLRMLYRTSRDNFFERSDGTKVQKFVNLDMEEYRDLNLTVDLFQKVLDEPEFFHYSAGIVLQSYVPDSHLIQQQLTIWAMQRAANGGAPIKIRIVKGANLAMEQVEASLRGWPQAPYKTKAEVDANFKRMVHYGFIPEHAKAAHLGIASHNLFDIAYAILLRAENGLEDYVEFEMLEGMADHLRRVVQQLTGEILLYCPAATREEFSNAVAYLVRRLDENTAPDNFLRHAFGLVAGTPEWQQQAKVFAAASLAADQVGVKPRRTQNRFQKVEKPAIDAPFQNEPDTDWALPQNRKWIANIVQDWSQRKIQDIPIVVGGKEIAPGEFPGKGVDPSNPEKVLYHYTRADSSHVEMAIKTAEKAAQWWSKTSVQERSELLAECAHVMRNHWGDLMGAMIADGGKVPNEADPEISEAIDFIEYYRRNMEELAAFKDINWSPKGVVLVAPPWNFPCSIPLGGIVAALASGNCVIFKPPSDTVLVGWVLCELLWKAGVSKEVLQFISGRGDVIGNQLVQDPRVSTVVLTGSTETAKHMLKTRPGLDLLAETGGKNAIIISSLADRDIAVRDAVQSAFGHAGQKCSACSLLICESEVYDDPHFRDQLRDTAASWKVGSQWDMSTRMNPLIHAPNKTLLYGLTQLEKGEWWLLEPKQDPKNSNIWTPGIKMGVTDKSFSYQNELFGPVLSVMKADDLDHALKLANGTAYGLTSGIHTLDEREREKWVNTIQAGNCYVNRGITGAIVRRQPFGGCKESSFGKGAKAGGPNYVMQLLHAEQKSLPTDSAPLSESLRMLSDYAEKKYVGTKNIDLWKASIGSYAYYWKNYFSLDHDPSKLMGQDNILRYVPHPKVDLRIQSHDSLFDVLRVIAAAEICSTPLVVSGDSESVEHLLNAPWMKKISHIKIVQETESKFIERVAQGEVKRLRLISAPSPTLQQAVAEAACNVHLGGVLANGRVELTNYVREVSLSIDYHRYGNLGDRENEKRAPIL